MTREWDATKVLFSLLPRRHPATIQVRAGYRAFDSEMFQGNLA